MGKSFKTRNLYSINYSSFEDVHRFIIENTVSAFGNMPELSDLKVRAARQYILLLSMYEARRRSESHRRENSFLTKASNWILNLEQSDYSLRSILLSFGLLFAFAGLFVGLCFTLLYFSNK